MLQLLAWIRKVGDETLRSQAILLRTAAEVAGVKDIEKDFEKFYFDAMVSRFFFQLDYLSFNNFTLFLCLSPSLNFFRCVVEIRVVYS